VLFSLGGRTETWLSHLLGNESTVLGRLVIRFIAIVITILSEVLISIESSN
jgi:hypothetical protein